MPKLDEVPWTEVERSEHPVAKTVLDAYSYRDLGAAGGLTQFGAILERLPPGATSSLRHWHEAEDELILVLEGSLLLIEEGRTDTLGQGDVAAWPAGAANGHCLKNVGELDAVYLVIGTRAARDRVHDPDHGLIVEKEGPLRTWIQSSSGDDRSGRSAIGRRIAPVWDWQTSPGVALRLAEDRDAPHLAGIYRRAVGVTGANYYSAEQVTAWLSLAPSAEQFAAMMADGRLRLVATDADDTPIGFVDLKADGHLHFLYVDPTAGGAGHGAALLTAALAAARRRSVERIYAEASEAALSSFLRQGFRQMERRDLLVAGVPIHNYGVELLLRDAHDTLEATV
jgi:putative acetyltransferase